MRVVVAAAGTGGHIYPALALINKIREKELNSDFIYIGTHNRMEKDIVPKYNIKYIPLVVFGFERKLTLKNFKTISSFFKAIKDAKRIIKEFKPDIVIGFGGYITGPVIYAASKLGYPTLVHEQNSILGLANRFLIRYVDKLAISFHDTKDYVIDDKKVVFTGNPCSEAAFKIKKIDKTTLGFKRDKKLVIIVMGSLGSDLINQKMKIMLQLFNNKEYEVLFITGKRYYVNFKDLKLTSNIKIVPYIDNLAALIKDSNLLVSRAGATIISEITTLNIPSILIPSPHVVDNHQLKNAIDLQRKGAIILIEEKDLHGDILVRKTDELFRNKSDYQKLKNNLRKIAINDSGEKLYKVVKELIDRSK